MKTKISPAIIGIALALSGCAGTQPAATPTVAIPIDATDPCEYAKQVVVQADKEYRETAPDGYGFFATTNKLDKMVELKQARANMIALCKKDGDDEGKSWACAEGHSCR